MCNNRLLGHGFTLGDFWYKQLDIDGTARWGAGKCCEAAVEMFHDHTKDQTVLDGITDGKSISLAIFDLPRDLGPRLVLAADVDGDNPLVIDVMLKVASLGLGEVNVVRMGAYFKAIESLAGAPYVPSVFFFMGNEAKLLIHTVGVMLKALPWLADSLGRAVVFRRVVDVYLQCKAVCARYGVHAAKEPFVSSAVAIAMLGVAGAWGGRC